MSETRKPNALTLINLASAYKVDLFTLEPEEVLDPENPPQYDFDSREDRLRYYENNGVYAIGKLSGNQLYEFELVFKKTLDKMINCWSSALMFELGLAENSTVLYNEEENEYVTPHGKLRGSPESNALRLVAFLFSCWGRVVGEDEKGNYMYENMSIDDMLDFLDYNYLEAMSINEDGADGFVWKCFNTARGFSTVPMTAEDELDDEAKNEVSDPENENSSSTSEAPKRSPRKRSKTAT